MHNQGVNPEALALPVAAHMRTTEFLNPEDSLARTGALLRSTAYPMVPILREGECIGAVSEASFAMALAEGESLDSPCLRALMIPPVTGPRVTGAEALRLLTLEPLAAFLVLDDQRHLLGIVSASDLSDDSRPMPTPHQIGGMATPFGVYLTTGSVSGGVSHGALFSVGALLFLIFALSDRAGWAVADAMGDSPFAAYAGTWLPVVLFLSAIRLLPLAGTHAAEHMVVHAIERGEQLRPEIVRRMPRVHPRCGTNLAVAATLFLSLFNWPWVPAQDLRLIVALLVTMVAYRPLGAIVQLLITTKPPNDRQIESGIHAGQELLKRYRHSMGPQATPFLRIVNSGMLHVMAGSIATYGVLSSLGKLFGFELV